MRRLPQHLQAKLNRQKMDIMERPSKGRELAYVHEINLMSVDPEPILKRTYHWYFSIEERDENYRPDKSRLPFWETLRKLEVDENKEVVNIQQFRQIVISYIDLLLLQKRIKEKEQQNKEKLIEVDLIE